MPLLADFFTNTSWFLRNPDIRWQSDGEKASLLQTLLPNVLQVSPYLALGAQASPLELLTMVYTGKAFTKVMFQSEKRLGAS
jgi:hypothetical protein